MNTEKTQRGSPAKKVGVRRVAGNGLLRRSIHLICCALALPAGQAAAQAPVLEEVIVTAEKRQQSLQDVPISMAAMDASALEKMGVTEVEDIGAAVPNVVTNEYFGIATTFRSFIRGVGAVTVEVTQDPAVALYVDGIYVGSSYGGSFESTDLERVEVLRGPQGTLYGRNATGGAINLISKKPELGAFQFGQTLTAGNYNTLKSSTAVNVPLGDIAAARLSLMFSDRDGMVENTGVGDDFGIEDRMSARLAFKVQPTDTFTIDLSTEYSTIEDTVRYSQIMSGQGATVAGTGGFLNIPLGPPGAPTVDVAYPDPVTRKRLEKAYSVFDVRPDDNRIFGSALTLTWDIADNVALKSITGYRSVDAEQFVLLTGTVQSFLNVPGVPFAIGPYTLHDGGIYDQEFSQFTQEFQIIGDTDLLGGRTEYTAGLYYYSDEGDNHNFASGIGGPGGTDRTETENSSVAVYGQATWTPEGSRLHITLGARYSEDQREATRTNTTVTPAFFDLKYDKDFKNFSPSLTVAYDLSDTVNVYAKAVTGYRSGGTSTLSSVESLFKAGADEETIMSYELGMKGDFLDRRLRVNGAVFTMDYKDYQGSIQTGPTPSDRDILNVGDNTIKGAELDITALLTENLTLTVAAGYLDTKMGEDSVDPGTGAPPTELIGELPFAPQLSYMVGLNYSRDVFNGLLFEGNVGYSYQDESESGVVVGTSQINDDTGLWDASISLSRIPLAAGTVRVSLWGKNLTDKEYAVSNIGPFAMFGANEISPYGDARTYGLTLRYDYE